MQNTYCQYCQLGFNSKIEVPQLGSNRLGNFVARLGSSWKIPARTHHFYLLDALFQGKNDAIYLQQK